MSEVRPKTHLESQAQVAAFAAEHVESFQNRDHIFKHIGQIAAGGLEDINRVTENTEYHNGINGEREKVESGSNVTAATSGDYVDFLRSHGGSNYDSIGGRTALLQSYEQFAPAIKELRDNIDTDRSALKQHNRYISNGSNSAVFELNDKNEGYVVRIPFGERVDPLSIDSHVAGAILGKGVPHLEQIVAASYEDGVTVSEKIPGKEIGKLSAEEIRGITDEQLNEIVDTLIIVHERGIQIDPKPSNYLYDSSAGFGIVDYHSSLAHGKKPDAQSLGDTVGMSSTFIDNAGIYQQSFKTTEDFARKLELKKANLSVLTRLRTIVEQKVTGSEQEKALERMDEAIRSDQNAISKYSDHEWVAEQVSREEKLASHQANANGGKTQEEGWTSISADYL